MKWSLAVCAVMLATGCNSYAPSGTDTHGLLYRQVPVSRAIVSVGDGACFLDLYFGDGSKLWVGRVDTRICGLK